MRHRLALLAAELKKANECADNPKECRYWIGRCQTLIKEMMEPPVVVRHTHRELVEIVDSMT